MNITDQMIAFYYKWHRLEEKNGNSIIDFDLILQGDRFPGEFQDHKQVRKSLDEIIKEYSKQSDRNIFIAEKLTGASYYLRALMNEKIPFHEFVENTMGIKPVMLSRQRIEEEMEKAESCLKNLGYKFTRNGIKELENDTVFHDKQSIVDSFHKFEKRIVPEVMEWLGLELKPNYRIEFEETEAYWLNYIGTDSKGEIVLTFNIHPRVVKKWRKGTTEFMVFHEICCHALQSLSWANHINNETLNPFCGLTSVFTSEQFISEGIAQTLCYFYPENPFSEYGLFFQHYNNLSVMVSCNAHIMINDGIAPDDIINYMESYLPSLEKDLVLKDLDNRANHPLLRTYQYIYGIGSYYHQEIAKKLDAEGKKNYILDIYKNIHTPKEILKKYDIQLGD